MVAEYIKLFYCPLKLFQRLYKSSSSKLYMVRGDRHAEFEWRADAEKQKELSQLDKAVNLQEVMQSAKESVTLNVLDKRKNELMQLHQAIGNNWSQELVVEHKEEKKGLFGTKEEIVEEINEQNRRKYYSYFSTLIEEIKQYRQYLQKNVDSEEESLKKINKLLAQTSIAKFPNYFAQEKVNPQQIMKTFPQLVHGITDLVAAEKIRVQEEQGQNHQQAA